MDPWDEESVRENRLTWESEERREEYELAIGEMHSAVDGDDDREWTLPVPKLSTAFKINFYEDNMNLSEQVIKQIKNDLSLGDETSLYEMLRLIEKTKNKQFLLGYISEKLV